MHACSVESNSLQTHGLNPPGSSVHGIFQARLLEWVAMSYSRGFSRPRDQTQVSCILHWQVDYVPLRRLGKLYFFHQRMDTCNLKLWNPGSPDRPWAGLLYRGGGGGSGRGSAQPRCFRLQSAVPGATSLHTVRCCHLELSVVCSISAH